ncbi:MAG: B12-binding domain-containing radical SAM protein [Synergistaceae bacterium]|nr:B12-binding domain-containing radical SAM protein [Synergistaceae bacterium]
MFKKTETIKFSEILSIREKTILGINPPVEDFAFFDLWSKPAGLLYLLNRMRINGNNVHLLDCIHEASGGGKSFGREKIRGIEIEKPSAYRKIKRRYHWFGLSEERITERLREMPKPDAVFLTSAMTYWYGGVKKVISILKQELPDVPVILGGTYARLCPEHAEGMGADSIVTDHWIPDSPFPAMDLYEKPPYGVTMTSFGCPLSCTYCASRILWPEYTRRSVPEVLREIAYQADLGAEDIAFYDDALLLNKRNYFYQLCAGLIKSYGDKIRFHTPNGLHVREIDDECAEILRKSGFKTIRLSLESIDPKMSGASSGKVAREEYAGAVRSLLKAGYSEADCETYILLGLPGQSTDSVKETIQFVHSSGGRPKLAEFSPIPGTPSFETAAREMPELRKEPLLHNNSVYSSWISGNISPEELQELKDLARKKS